MTIGLGHQLLALLVALARAKALAALLFVRNDERPSRSALEALRATFALVKCDFHGGARANLLPPVCALGFPADPVSRSELDEHPCGRGADGPVLRGPSLVPADHDGCA
jgi:hypothetical protein